MALLFLTLKSLSVHMRDIKSNHSNRVWESYHLFFFFGISKLACSAVIFFGMQLCNLHLLILIYNRCNFDSMCQLRRFMVFSVIILNGKNWYSNGFYLLKSIHILRYASKKGISGVFVLCIANPFLCFTGRKSSFKLMDSKIVCD